MTLLLTMTSPAPSSRVAEFHEVYLAEIPFVCRMLVRLGVEKRHVHDLAHDVFLAAFQGFDSYDRARPVRPWLLGICFHRAQAFGARAQQQREHQVDYPEVVDERPDAAEEIEARQGRELVLKGLSALDLEKRAVFAMHDIEGCAMPEVAEALSIPLNTAYSRLRRARELFKAEVQRLRVGGGSS
ncbi:MAG: sigma-70 family RNA polymerase sigma factor [Deltaproteobacteria bacterium]|nr:sigma-70 family RNA polymerase sigma factor [Deltaproteobacteria bacterium]